MRTSSPVRVLLLPVKEQVSQCGAASKLGSCKMVKRNFILLQMDTNVEQKSGSIHHVQDNVRREGDLL